MNRGERYRSRRAGRAMVVLAASALGGSLHAMEFETEGGWKGNWNTTAALASAWRAKNPDLSLVSPANGPVAGITGGSGGSNSDTGDINYRKGDRFSTVLKLITEVDFRKEGRGGLLRAKAWYDDALNTGHTRLGNQANGYTPGAPMSDRGFEPLQRFDGVALLDAYVYDSYDVMGKPLQVRLGKQVVNWGESIFIQGVNQINPIDVPAFRRPGVELKEALIPVWMIHGNQNLGEGTSLEAFYQFKWENTPVEGCGNYWSITESAISTSPGGCPVASTLSGGFNSVAALTSPVSLLAGGQGGAYYALADGKKARDGGQFGLALRFPVAALDTEFGLYDINIHSRTPIVSARTGNAFGAFLNVPAAFAALGLRPGTGFWEYPEKINIFGLSAATNLLGWSVAAELSHARNVPVQRNGNDLLAGLAMGVGPLGTQAAAVSGTAGNTMAGYDRFDKTQFQFNGVKIGGGVLGALQTMLVGEAGFQWNNVPDYKSDPTAVRYGRAFVFGYGAHAAYLPTGSVCFGNPSADGCRNDGYVTRYSWGYRLKGQLEYSNVFDSGVTAYPNLYWSHDVRGHSMDGQFIEGRKQLGAGVRFNYARKYNLELNYATFGNARYDPLRDRDYYSASLSVSF